MSHALAALTEAGVPLEPALRLAGTASSCIPAADALTEAASRVLLEPDGASGPSPEDMKRLPGPVRQWAADAAVAAAAVKRGNSGGGDAAEPARLSGLLEWVGRRADQDLGRALKRLRTRMEPLLTLLFGGMIALILICLYYPIFNLGHVIS
jgi:type II secretory pathway component PulF